MNRARRQARAPLLQALRARSGRWPSAGDAHLAAVLPAGARLLVAGNGGSAAQAQHLTAEIVGRYRVDRAAVLGDRPARRDLRPDRDPQRLRRRTRCSPGRSSAHGRAGDVCLLMSTSGRSPNVRRRGAGGRETGPDGVGDDRRRAQPARRVRATRRSASTPRTPRPCRRCTWSRCTCVCEAFDAALGRRRRRRARSPSGVRDDARTVRRGRRRAARRRRLTTARPAGAGRRRRRCSTSSAGRTRAGGAALAAAAGGAATRRRGRAGRAARRRRRRRRAAARRCRGRVARARAAVRRRDTGQDPAALRRADRRPARPRRRAAPVRSACPAEARDGARRTPTRCWSPTTAAG